MHRHEKILLIHEALEVIRPYMQSDAGDIEFVDLAPNNIVLYRFTGNCKDCRLKGQTALSVEKHIRKFLPELRGIKEVD